MKKKMRNKLSEIVSTIDQYNGLGEYSDKYEDGDQVAVSTELTDPPAKARLSENEDRIQQLIQRLLTENNGKSEKDMNSIKESPCYVLSFDDFVNEQKKGTPSNVQSYFGDIDDEDDLDEEE